MADFSFNCDSSDEEEAISELLNQAMDLSVLEQIAKINCSSFSSDSVLPTHLENRFSRLKTFPVSNQKTSNFSSGKKPGSRFQKKGKGNDDPESDGELKENSRSGSDDFSSKALKSVKKGEILRKSEVQSYSDDEFEENPVGKIESKRVSRSKSMGKGKVLGTSEVQSHSDDEFGENPVGKSESKRVSRSKSMGKAKILRKAEVQLQSDDEFGENQVWLNELERVSRSKSLGKSKISARGRGLEKNLEPGYGSSPSNSSISSIENVLRERKGGKSMKKEAGLGLSRSTSSDFSPSPPRKSGCFWCSPKKSSAKKVRGNGGFNRELLSELSILSVKNQQKLLEKSMREEEKIKREAEKIVQWAKQGSARFNISDIDD